MHRHPHSSIRASGIGLALVLISGWSSAAPQPQYAVDLHEQRTPQTSPMQSPYVRHASLQPDAPNDAEQRPVEDAQDNWITAPQQPVQGGNQPLHKLRF